MNIRNGAKDSADMALDLIHNLHALTARFRGAAVRAVFDKRSTLCLRKMTPYVWKWCERRPRGCRNRHVRSLLGTGLV